MPNWESTLTVPLDMIGYHLEFFDLGLLLFTHLTDKLFSALLNRRIEHLLVIFRTPDHMIVAGIAHVPVALVSLAHTIQYTVFNYLLSRTFVLAIPGIPLLPDPNKERALHPHS